MRHTKMESMPGQSDDSHPCCLVEHQRKEYVLPCPALPQSLFTEQVVRQVQEAAREVCKFLFFFGGSSSEDSKISDIQDIFNNLLVSINSGQLKNNMHLLKCH